MEQDVHAVSWWRRPVWLGLVGLALMVGGWKLSVYVPTPPLLEEVRGLADKSDERELRDRLDEMRRNVHGEAPYQLAGRLVFLAGLLMFAASAVQMYRQPPAERKEEPEDEPAELE